MRAAVRLGDQPAFLVRLRGGVFLFTSGRTPRAHAAFAGMRVDLGTPERLAVDVWLVRCACLDTGRRATVPFAT